MRPLNTVSLHFSSNAAMLTMSTLHPAAEPTLARKSRTTLALARAVGFGSTNRWGFWECELPNMLEVLLVADGFAQAGAGVVPIDTLTFGLDAPGVFVLDHGRCDERWREDHGGEIFEVSSDEDKHGAMYQARKSTSGSEVDIVSSQITRVYVVVEFGRRRRTL